MEVTLLLYYVDVFVMPCIMLCSLRFVYSICVIKDIIKRKNALANIMPTLSSTSTAGYYAIARRMWIWVGEIF